MSGHSKWASIKHKKGAADAKKGALYTKIIKEITMAARNGGGNPDMNSALRTAMAKATTVATNPSRTGSARRADSAGMD